MQNKVIIFSAPSGSGKSTIVNHILGLYPELEFSISATSRAPRGNERNGREYYFFSADEFRKMISEDKFVEYEEVYAGSFYGTLKSLRGQGPFHIHSGTVRRMPARAPGRTRHRLGRSHRKKSVESCRGNRFCKREIRLHPRE